MAEIFPGVHQIRVDYNGRPLKLYLLIGEEASLLMDTGDAGIPERDILPYFQQIHFAPARLTFIMATHPDVDHTGGLARMKQAVPQAKLCCGTLDREQCETPEGLMNIRNSAYLHWHQIGPDAAARQKILPRCGGPVALDFTLNGGEVLRLGESLQLQILHLPGHSRGHLGIFLPGHNAAIIGDAVHGNANLFLNGRQAFAPTYMHIDAYLGTIAQLQAMKLDQVFSCHWSDCVNNAAVHAWMEQSRQYALAAERIIFETVKAAGATGLTLKETCLQAKAQLGTWPVEKDMATAQMACGHLQRLVEMGRVRVSETPPVRYVVEEKWRGLK